MVSQPLSDILSWFANETRIWPTTIDADDSHAAGNPLCHTRHRSCSHLFSVQSTKIAKRRPSHHLLTAGGWPLVISLWRGCSQELGCQSEKHRRLFLVASSCRNSSDQNTSWVSPDNFVLYVNVIRIDRIRFETSLEFKFYIHFIWSYSDLFGNISWRVQRPNV